MIMSHKHRTIFEGNFCEWEPEPISCRKNSFELIFSKKKNLALGASKVDSGPNQIKSNPLTQTNPLSKSLHLKSMLPWAEPRCSGGQPIRILGFRFKMVQNISGIKKGIKKAIKHHQTMWIKALYPKSWAPNSDLMNKTPLRLQKSKELCSAKMPKGSEASRPRRSLHT